jgi:hypothetical protein
VDYIERYAEMPPMTLLCIPLCFTASRIFSIVGRPGVGGNICNLIKPFFFSYLFYILGMGEEDRFLKGDKRLIFELSIDAGIIMTRSGGEKYN